MKYSSSSSPKYHYNSKSERMGERKPEKMIESIGAQEMAQKLFVPT